MKIYIVKSKIYSKLPLESLEFQRPLSYGCLNGSKPIEIVQKYCHSVSIEEIAGRGEEVLSTY